MQNGQPNLYRNLFVSKLSIVTYPCFITWRFHNFITSFSPSLTSENSSICWRNEGLGERIGKETNIPIRTACLLTSSESTPKIQLMPPIHHRNNYWWKFRHCSQTSYHVETCDDKFFLYYIHTPLCTPVIPASPLWRRQPATNNENLLGHMWTKLASSATKDILENTNFDSVNFYHYWLSITKFSTFKVNASFSQYMPCLFPTTTADHLFKTTIHIK